MRISKWKHPIRHWRCVHTSSCRECKHATFDPISRRSRYGCTNPRVIGYADRTSGVHYDEVYDEYEGGCCENGFKCSKCGELVEDCEGCRVKGTFNYCPNCGAEVGE